MEWFLPLVSDPRHLGNCRRLLQPLLVLKAPLLVDVAVRTALRRRRPPQLALAIAELLFDACRRGIGFFLLQRHQA